MKRKYVELEIDTGKCTGCAMCVRICPDNALAITGEGRKRRMEVAAPQLCDGCGFCALVCTVNAIVVRKLNLTPALD